LHQTHRAGRTDADGRKSRFYFGDRQGQARWDPMLRSRSSEQSPDLGGGRLGASDRLVAGERNEGPGFVNQVKRREGESRAPPEKTYGEVNREDDAEKKDHRLSHPRNRPEAQDQAAERLALP